MWAGIAALASGERLSAVARRSRTRRAGRPSATAPRYGIVEDYVGHGIGSAMHQPPDVLNYRTRERGPAAAARHVPRDRADDHPRRARDQRLEDDWTVVTGDGSRAAHWEHSAAILEDGIVVLTAVDGGAERLADFGVPCRLSDLG